MPRIPHSPSVMQRLVRGSLSWIGNPLPESMRPALECCRGRFNAARFYLPQLSYVIRTWRARCVSAPAVGSCRECGPHTQGAAWSVAIFISRRRIIDYRCLGVALTAMESKAVEFHLL